MEKKKPHSKLKYYLAHSIKDRHDIRDWEQKLEGKFGIELVNPFYDAGEIGNMKLIDTGKRDVYDAAFDSKEIVEGDLELIKNSDGVIAVITKNLSIGTNMEIFFNAYVLKRPTYIIIEPRELRGHSWLRYMSGKFSGHIYKSRAEFEGEFFKIDNK